MDISVYMNIRKQTLMMEAEYAYQTSKFGRTLAILIAGGIAVIC
jgi:hypothetical protein